MASLAGFIGEGLGSVLPKLQAELPGKHTVIYESDRVVG